VTVAKVCSADEVGAGGKADANYRVPYMLHKFL